jgi:PEP-CTERM motif
VDGLTLPSGEARIQADLQLSGVAHVYRGRLVLAGDVSGAGSFDNRQGAAVGTGELEFQGAYRPDLLDVHLAVSRVSFADTARLELDIASSSQFEHLRVDGSLEAAGTLGLHFSDAAAWQDGGRIDLMDWGSVQGAFRSIEVTGLDAKRVDLSRLDLDGSVTVSAVPEPASWAMLLSGMAFVAWRRSRVQRDRA